MEPMTVMATINAAKGILDATGLGDWLGDKIGHRTADKVVAVAEALTGTADPKKVKALPDEVLVGLHGELVNHEKELRELHAKDVADARKMYQNTDHTMADKIADRVIKYNLPMVFVLAGLNVVALVFIKNPTLGVAIGTALGASINHLWQERRTVIEFFFGSSQGSKDKTKVLSK